MNKCKVLCFLVLMLFAPLVLMTLEAYATAVVWTDKADYANWETVTIYGSGFYPSTNINLVVTRPDLVVEAHSTMSDASGDFVYYYVLNGLEGTYTVTATDGTNTATTTFTESDHVDWVQGLDDTAPHDGTVDTTFTWHSGAINAQNSIFAEGNTLPTYPPNVPGQVNYRAIIEDKNLGSGTYNMTIEYEFTKGGKVAFDFLTTNYNVTDSNLQTQLPGWADSSKISSLVTAGPSTATFPNDGFTLPSSLGSGLVQHRQSAHDTVFASLNPRTMKLYGATITGITQGPHTGSPASDSDVTVVVTFTKSTDATWPVIATWSGHLGIGAAHPVGYGVGNGAGSVSGAPFHMALGSVVDTITSTTIITGKRDLAVQIGAITPPPGNGTIVVEKITLGGVDTFNYIGAGTTLPPGFSSFSLTTVTSGVAVSTGFANVNPGTYTVTEQALTGWDLTDITIIDPDSGSSYTGSTATLDIDSGETVTVTFTNTKRGKIIVDKITVPAADPQSFGFDASGPNSYSASFSLTDAQTPWDSGWLKPGSGYSVTETMPVGWDLTSVTVNGAGSSNGASLTLSAGQILYVNFTDTKRGKIIVCKETIPDGDLADFTFEADYQTDFVLSDGECNSSDWLVPGTYNVTELVPVGWDLATPVIVESATANSADNEHLVLDAGETITVTFTDTKRGKIIVDKITVPAADPQSFTFTTTGSGYSGFSLTDGATPNDSGWLVPGTYTVTETVPVGWSLTSVTKNGVTFTNGGNIVLGAGEIVYVNFTNTKAPPAKASIGDFVWKDLDGNGIQDAGEPGLQGVTVELYTSTPALVGTTTTGASGAYSFTNLNPGNYYLKFYAPSGYVFSPQDQGTDDAKDSDANPSTGQTVVTTLTSGETDNTWDAGLYEGPPPPPPPPPVGGVWVPINKSELLAPWIGLGSASLIMVFTASVVYAKYRKKKRN